MTAPDTAAIRAQMEVLTGFTPGPWTSKAMGGSSTVLTIGCPPRNDRRCTATFGHQGEHSCIAYPFVGEDYREVRFDFVCFGHEDARLIAAAPDMHATILALCDALDEGAAREAALLAEGERLREAARELINSAQTSYRARNGRQISIEADDGEGCLIVHSDLMHSLTAALAQGDR